MTAERKAEQTSDVFAMCPMCGVSTCIPATDDEKRAAGLLPPLPTESEPERAMVCARCDRAKPTSWKGVDSHCDDGHSHDWQLETLSPAPETPSPEVGMREKAHRLLDELIAMGPEPPVPDHVCVLGVTDCDGECAAFGYYNNAKWALMEAIHAAAKEQSK